MGVVFGFPRKFASQSWRSLSLSLQNRLRRKKGSRASLVAQWLRICLPTQGTQVRALVREDPTCHGAAKPVHHNY